MKDPLTVLETAFIFKWEVTKYYVLNMFIRHEGYLFIHVSEEIHNRVGKEKTRMANYQKYIKEAVCVYMNKYEDCGINTEHQYLYPGIERKAKAQQEAVELGLIEGKDIGKYVVVEVDNMKPTLTVLETALIVKWKLTKYYVRKMFITHNGHLIIELPIAISNIRDSVKGMILFKEFVKEAIDVYTDKYKNGKEVEYTFPYTETKACNKIKTELVDKGLIEEREKHIYVIVRMLSPSAWQ